MHSSKLNYLNTYREGKIIEFSFDWLMETGKYRYVLKES